MEINVAVGCQILDGQFSRYIVLRLSRYRIITASAPRMAPQEASDGQIKAAYGAVLPQCLHGILAARGSESARRGCQWRNHTLIEADGQDE